MQLFCVYLIFMDVVKDYFNIKILEQIKNNKNINIFDLKPKRDLFS